MTQNQIQNQPQGSEKNKRNNGNKTQIVLGAGLGLLLFAVSGLELAWADTGNSPDIHIKATDAIKNDPALMKVLYNIELFKQRYAAQQQKQTLIDQQQQFIEQQRKIANSYLQADLNSMNNFNDLSTPKNAYASFVSHVNNSTQNLFWDQFGYMQNKVLKAKLAMNQVIQNGGSREEALQAYYNAAATHETDLVDVNKQLNVKYNLADKNTQNLFNKYGNVQKYSAS